MVVRALVWFLIKKYLVFLKKGTWFPENFWNFSNARRRKSLVTEVIFEIIEKKIRLSNKVPDTFKSKLWYVSQTIRVHQLTKKYIDRSNILKLVSDCYCLVNC